MKKIFSAVFVTALIVAGLVRLGSTYPQTPTDFTCTITTADDYTITGILSAAGVTTAGTCTAASFSGITQAMVDGLTTAATPTHAGLISTGTVTSTTFSGITQAMVDGLTTAATPTFAGLISTGTVTSTTFSGITQAMVDGLTTAATPTFTGVNLTSLLTFTSSGRVNWSATIASSVTLTAGTSSDLVTDIQTAYDGNFYDITEAAGTPGINLIADFTNVTMFSWLNILACYNGQDTHAVAVQLYNWSAVRWDTIDKLISSTYDITTANGYVIGNHDISPANPTPYIGTGGDAGKVRVRFYHSMAGNNSHHMVIDAVVLYR